MISKSAFKARVQETSAGSSLATIPDDLLDKVCGGNGPGDFRDMFQDGPSFTDTFHDVYPYEPDPWKLPQTPKPPTTEQDQINP